MNTVKIGFKDAYDIAHNGAVFVVSHGYCNSSNIQTIGDNASVAQNIVVNCQFKYWTSQAAKDEGYQPMLLTTATGITMFDAYPQTEEEAADLEAYCLNQLTTVILPAIDPNMQIIV